MLGYILAMEKCIILRNYRGMNSLLEYLNLIELLVNVSIFEETLTGLISWWDVCEHVFDDI